jgi:hypothetical protein
MVTRRRLLVAAHIALVALAAVPARADSPRLAEARRAVAAVDYDAARRLLVEALHDGDNSPAAMTEIYRLSARAAVVLDQPDLAEQYYRRWLAIDPDAALPADTAPKLREPFVAAQAYIAAHGRLRARAQRTAAGAIAVELLADPLAMAHAASALEPLHAPAGTTPAGLGPGAAGPANPGDRRVLPPVRFDAEHRVQLAAAARVAILDEQGNRLVELDPEPVAPAAAALPAPADQPSPPWTRSWTTWAIPTGVFTLGAAGFGIAAIASYGRAQQQTDQSGQNYLSDAEANVRRGRIFTWITAGAGAAAIGFAIPTAIFFRRDHYLGHLAVAPSAAPGQIGVVLGGRF